MTNKAPKKGYYRAPLSHCAQYYQLMLVARAVEEVCLWVVDNKDVADDARHWVYELCERHWSFGALEFLKRNLPDETDETETILTHLMNAVAYDSSYSTLIQHPPFTPHGIVERALRNIMAGPQTFSKVSIIENKYDERLWSMEVRRGRSELLELDAYSFEQCIENGDFDVSILKDVQDVVTLKLKFRSNLWDRLAKMNLLDPLVCEQVKKEALDKHGGVLNPRLSSGKSDVSVVGPMERTSGDPPAMKRLSAENEALKQQLVEQDSARSMEIAVLKRTASIRETLYSQLANSNAQLSESQSALQELQGELTKQKEKYEELEKRGIEDKRRYKTRQHQLEKMLREKTTEVAQCEVQLKTQFSKVIGVEDKLKRTQTQLDNKERELRANAATHSKEIVEKDRIITTLQTKVNEATAQLEQARSSLDEMNDRLAAQQRDHKNSILELQGQLDQERDKRQELEDTVKENNKELRAKRKEIKDWEKRFKAQLKRIEDLEESLIKTRKRLDKASTAEPHATSDSENRIRALETELTGMREQLKAKKRLLSTKQELVNHLRGQIAQYRDQENTSAGEQQLRIGDKRPRV